MSTPQQAPEPVDRPGAVCFRDGSVWVYVGIESSADLEHTDNGAVVADGELLGGLADEFPPPPSPAEARRRGTTVDVDGDVVTEIGDESPDAVRDGAVIALLPLTGPEDGRPG